jgi:hypothetical protein
MNHLHGKKNVPRIIQRLKTGAVRYLPFANGRFVRKKTLRENNNAALMRRYVSAYGKPISSAIEY